MDDLVRKGFQIEVSREEGFQEVVQHIWGKRGKTNVRSRGGGEEGRRGGRKDELTFVRSMFSLSLDRDFVAFEKGYGENLGVVNRFLVF